MRKVLHRKMLLVLSSLVFLISGLIALEDSNSSLDKTASSDIKQKSDQEISKSLLPKRIIAGFLDIRTPGSTTRVDIDQVKKDGYNVMIVAYGEVYGTEIGFYSSDSTSTQTAIDKVRQAKKLGIKVLLAVGGAPNTFHPGIQKGEDAPKIWGKKMSEADITTLANNIVSFLKKYNIDGIEYSFKKYTSPVFINSLSSKIKQIDPNVIIAVEPEVNNFKLVTTGRSNDYDMAIQDGNIDYLFLQEYNTFPQYDPDFIADSYSKIIEQAKVPITTKVLIGEPTNALAGGTNTIYHPEGNATKSLTTEEAIALMLPELEQLKFKPRFAGVVGWSLNTDYAADLYGDSRHNPGAFAKGLYSCIYNNTCAPVVKRIDGPIIAGVLSLWGRNSSYNIGGQQVNSTPIDISMPKDKEYCDQNPNICKYNVIIAAYLTYTASKGFELSFNEENGSSTKVYTPEELKLFIDYMKSKGKHILVSLGGKFSHIDWKNIDLNKLVNVVQDYGFDGLNFDLTGSDIPKDKDISAIAARKITGAFYLLKQKDPNFWLTFSPQWHYLVAPLADNSKDNIYTNHNYIDLLNLIGINNINYIWVNTYAESAQDGVLGFYKDKEGEYLKVSPLDGYPKFLASLAWAMTTQDGYDANMPKYKIDVPIKIPASKLAFSVPATKGAAHSGGIYVLSKNDIDESISLMEKNKASFAGFAIWNIDFDAANIKAGSLGGDYFHEPWSTTDAIANIKLPPVASQIIDKTQKVSETLEQNESKLDTGIINYPDDIGSYTGDTKVEYQGKRYKCISDLEAKLCNDNGYIPDGLHGYLAWDELDEDNNIKIKPKKRILKEGETPTYPDGLGSYKIDQIVIAGDKKFECLKGKETLCNSIIYSPMKEKGYLAWTDITSDVIHLDENNIVGKFKPQGAEYIYPNGISSYDAGTTVAVGQDLYRCKVGPEASLCSMKAYDPTGKYGPDAWNKVDS